jgi:UDP-glucose 4-epimerase
LITGATGFVGSNLIQKLLQEGFLPGDIILLVGSAAGAAAEQWKKQGFRLLEHRGYTYAPEDLQKLLSDEEIIDTVIHLGAATPKGVKADETTDFNENIRTTQHLVRTLPNMPKRFLFGSSVSVSHAAEPTVDGRYGRSKRDCEEWLTGELSGCALWILRFGPVYGPGEERYRKIAGTFLRQAMNNETIHLKGDGSSLRRMVYVGDLCEEICRIVSCGRENRSSKDSCGCPHIVDITNPEAISIRQIAEFAVAVTGSTSRIYTETAGNITESIAEFGDADGMPTSYREGIQKLYEWFCKHK